MVVGRGGRRTEAPQEAGGHWSCLDVATWQARKVRVDLGPAGVTGRKTTAKHGVGIGLRGRDEAC